MRSSPQTPAPDCLLLRGGRIVHRDRILRGDVLARHGTVVSVGDVPTPEGARVFDVSDLLVAPGFVDLQTNGAGGIDVTTEPGRLWELGEHLTRQGVTTFVPTIVSCPSSTLRHAQRTVMGQPPKGYRGARVLGLHLEGPMLAPARRGAHPADHLRVPSADLIADWAPHTGVRMATLAPELPGAPQAIRTLHQRGIIVAAGHSEATSEQAQQAFGNGVRLGTHLYNAMAPLRAREPGLVGALLTHADAYVSLIADGVHVAPTAMRLAWQAKGPDRTILITDAMAAAGMGDGCYRLGAQTVHVDGRRAVLDDGTLAGSVLLLDDAVRYLCATTGCAVPEAIATVTSTPARLLGAQNIGRIAVGQPADLTVLTPDLHVVATIVAGQPVHSTPEVTA